MDTKQITLEEIAFINDIIGRFNAGVIVTTEEKETFKTLIELVAGQNIVESMGASVLSDQTPQVENIGVPEENTGLENEMPVNLPDEEVI